MRLQLAQIDDGVGFPEIGRIREVLCLHGVGVFHFLNGEVVVQFGAKLLRLPHSAHVVDRAKIGGGVDPARPVADHNLRAALPEHFYQRADNGRVDRCGRVRLHGRHKVHLDGHTHPGLYKGEAVYRVQNFPQRGFYGSFLIAVACGKRNVPFFVSCAHGFPSQKQLSALLASGGRYRVTG